MFYKESKDKGDKMVIKVEQNKAILKNAVPTGELQLGCLPECGQEMNTYRRNSKMVSTGWKIKSPMEEEKKKVAGTERRMKAHSRGIYKASKNKRDLSYSSSNSMPSNPYPKSMITTLAS